MIRIRLDEPNTTTGQVDVRADLLELAHLLNRLTLSLTQVANMRRIAWIAEHCDARKSPDHVPKQFQPLTSEVITSPHSEAGKISSGARKTRS